MKQDYQRISLQAQICCKTCWFMLNMVLIIIKWCLFLFENGLNIGISYIELHVDDLILVTEDMVAKDKRDFKSECSINDLGEIN